jgi:hypothetical protein
MADSYHASVHTMLEQTRADEKEAASERTAMRDFLPQDTMGTAACTVGRLRQQPGRQCAWATA